MVSSLNEHEIPKSAIAVNSAISTVILCLVFADFVLVLTLWLLGLLIFTGILFIGWISAGIDDGLNPWIRKTEMNWTSFFTTRHYNTWLYIKDAQAWLILNTFFFLPISISLAALFVNPLLSLGLTVLSLLSSFIVLVVIHRYS